MGIPTRHGFVEAPETRSGPSEGKKHWSGSRSTVYHVGVSLSCLKIAFMATLLPQLEPAAVAVSSPKCVTSVN